MSARQLRRDVLAAHARLARVRVQCREETAWLESHIARHREAITVGSGFALGVLASSLPLKRWLGASVTVVSAAFSLARTPIGPIVFGGLFARHGAADADTTSD